MVQSIQAYYDGEVLRPDEPLEFEPNTRVQLTVETIAKAESAPRSFLQIARSRDLRGPEDWSSNLDC